MTIKARLVIARAVWLTDEEIAECEQRQSMTAVLVPTSEQRQGCRLVAVSIVWEGSLDDETVEEHDAWWHEHTAVVELAAAEDAAALVEQRAARLAREDAQRRLDEAMGEIQPREFSYSGRKVARWIEIGSEARQPYIVATKDGAVYHVRPVYDDSPLVTRIELSVEETLELAAEAGWRIER
jgi:hypothetical protein